MFCYTVDLEQSLKSILFHLSLAGDNAVKVE